MALLFISGVSAPKGQSSSGGNALLGIADALCNYVQDSLDLISYPITPSFPNGKFWIPKYYDTLDNGKSIRYLSTLNVKIVKSQLWGWQCYRIILEWAKQHRGEELRVLVYNTYHPSIDTIYRASRSVGAKLYAILYDLGVPPKRLGLSRLTMMGYKMAEQRAKKYIPLLDGRIIINELIEEYYAPGKDFILIDGGINRYVISHLFPIEERKGVLYTYVLAGMLWDQNGTRLVLDAMEKYSNPNVRVVFAGKGNDVSLIEKAAKKDSRVSYVGMLGMDDLFKLYESADVLLNIRLEEDVDFHFPGKLLEYLATGRYVISTPIAHAERDYGEFIGFLYDRTPDGLIRMMDEVQKRGKKQLFEVGVKARQFMLENRTWDKQTQRILEYMYNSR